jgi:hypothetical protein
LWELKAGVIPDQSLFEVAKQEVRVPIADANPVKSNAPRDPLGLRGSCCRGHASRQIELEGMFLPYPGNRIVQVETQQSFKDVACAEIVVNPEMVLVGTPLTLSGTAPG